MDYTRPAGLNSFGIGSTVTSGTAGSVLFVGAGGTLAQDNANFFWDDTNDRLGLGINSAIGSRLVVKGAGATSATSSLNVTTSANTSILFVRNDSRVGIGTTTPGCTLNVASNMCVGSGFHNLAAQSNGLAVERNLSVGSVTGDYAGTTGRVLTIYTAAATADMEFVSAYPDTAGATIGGHSWVYDSNSASHKIIASLRAVTVGATANQRGGYLVLQTKANGSTTLSTRIFIGDDGKVGVGETAPSQKFVVKGDGNSSATTAMFVKDSSNNPILVARDDCFVGVAISSPEAAMHVRYTSTSTTASGLIIDNGNANTQNKGAALKFQSTDANNNTHRDSGRIYSNFTVASYASAQMILQIATAADTWTDILTLNIGGIVAPNFNQIIDTTVGNAAIFNHTPSGTQGQGVGLKLRSTNANNTGVDSGRLYANTGGSAYSTARISLQNPTAEDTWTDTLNCVGGQVGVRTTSPGAPLHVLTDDTTNTGVSRVFRISHTVSNSPGNGIGVGMDFEVETSASNNEIGMAIDAVAVDTTSTSEDFDFVLRLMTAGAAVTERLRVTSDGRLYGKNLHNNANGVTGTANQYIASGTYTPTVSSATNLDSTPTATEAQWMRVGNVVTVTGRFTADPTTTTTSTDFELSLPIASNLGAAEDLAGVAFCGAIAGQGAAIFGVAANDTAQVIWLAGDVTSQTWSYTFTYEVI